MTGDGVCPCCVPRLMLGVFFTTLCGVLGCVRIRVSLLLCVHRACVGECSGTKYQGWVLTSAPKSMSWVGVGVIWTQVSRGQSGGGVQTPAGVHSVPGHPPLTAPSWPRLFREQSAWGGPGAVLYLSGIREWGCKGRARSPGAARARGTRAADVRRLLK